MCRTELQAEKKEKYLEQEKIFLYDHALHFEQQWQKYGNAVQHLLKACDKKDRKIIELNEKARELQQKINEVRQAKL